jgi:hypothetical protein
MLRIIECGIELDDEMNIKNPHDEFKQLGDALWYIYITFCTIGYGDYFPKTNAGRVIGLATGLLGTAITSVTIVMMEQRFKLKGYEKNVRLV